MTSSNPLVANPFVGTWAYRSMLNESDLTIEFDKLEFGRGTLTITEAGPVQLGGTIGGPGWSLALRGSFGFGSPMQVRFQGKGDVDGVPWVYDYIAWLVPDWPASAEGQQVDALVGSVTRTIFHGSGPAGEVASFYAVRQTAG